MSLPVPAMSTTYRLNEDRSRRLSAEEAHRLIGLVRRKSNDGHTSKDRNLRIFLGHAHLSETLKQQFADGNSPFKHEPFDTRQHSPSSSSRHSQHIRWADSFSEKEAVRGEALEIEDDGEEDFGSLVLVRTPSHAAEAPRPPF